MFSFLFGEDKSTMTYTDRSNSDYDSDASIYGSTVIYDRARRCYKYGDKIDPNDPDVTELRKERIKFVLCGFEDDFPAAVVSATYPSIIDGTIRVVNYLLEKR